MGTKYRVAWKNLITGHRGHGEPLCSWGHATAWALAANKKHDAIHHWVEPVEVEEEK